MIASAKQPKLQLLSATNSSNNTPRNTNSASTTPSIVKSSPRSAKKSVTSSGSVDKQTRPVTVNQSVPFLQRKFNIFGGSSSASTLSRTPASNNEKSARSSIRGSSNSKSQVAATLPRNSATRSSVTRSSVGKGSTATSASSGASATKAKGEESGSSDTFKGVQNLKQFWNSRISSGGNKSGPSGGQSITKSKIRKVESVSNKSATPPVVSEVKKKTTTTTVAVTNVPVKTGGDEITTKKPVKGGNCGAAVTLRQSASFAKSDNFNKYKTASSVKQQHRVSYNDLGRNNSTRGSTRQQQHQSKRHTVDSVSVCIPRTSPAKQPAAASTAVATSPSSPSAVSEAIAASTNPVGHNRSTLKFPQIATTAGGAKIHWPKREDILLLDKSRRKSLEAQNSTGSVTMIKETEAKESLSTTKLIAKTDAQKETKRPRDEVKKEMKTMEAATNMSPRDEESPKSSDKDATQSRAKEEMLKTEESLQSSRSATPSSISLASNAATSRTDSPRKVTATRKASFKTHSGQSQSIRKLAVGSKVAALAHRFNQLVQTDATIMEQVKRKGVLVHRMNGHVYKIKEDPANAATTATNAASDEVLGKRKSLSRTTSNAESSPSKPGLNRRKSSVKKHDPLRKNNSTAAAASAMNPTNANEKKGVKATIELFEPNSVPPKRNAMKPKVPDKSEHVLRRTKELVSTRRDVSSGREEPQSRMSFRLGEIKEGIEEKGLTPIQEALPPVPAPDSDRVNEPSSMAAEMDKSNNSSKKDKSVYGRIYEKLKINKSSFLYAKKAPAIPSPATPTLQISNPVLNSSTYNLSDPVPLGSNSSVDNIPPEQKIFEALESIDRKIENLHKSSIELSSPVSKDDDQAIKPNQSFLFRSTSIKTPVSSPATSHQSSFDLTSTNAEPCAAMNVSLIKSKTMSMDERNFPFICRAAGESSPDHSVSTSDLQTVPLIDDLPNVAETRNEYQEIINETDKLIRRMNEAYSAGENEEADDGTHPNDDEAVKSVENNYDLYEQITSELEQRGKEAGNGNKPHSPPTARDEPAIDHHDDDDDDEEEEEEEEESIYQTVTEVKSAIRQAFITDEASVNSYESCGNYEAIDELRRTYRAEQKRLNGSGSGGSSENGGYEICEPPEPPPPRKISAPSLPMTEAPQLPVPKRNKGPLAPVPKSTFYAPAPEVDKGQQLPPPIKDIHSNSTDIFHSDHVYEENIYDTIKSLDNTSLLSNNYESISLIRGTVNGESKLAISGNGAASGGDTMSNGYESLRGSTLTINHLSHSNNPGNKFGKSDYYNAGLNGLRHSESVSTLASDHKTNSIYGTTMHYGGSIATNPGDRHSIAGTSMAGSSPLGSDNEVYTKMKHPPSENGTTYSSENSDEWVDISDGEEGATAGEDAAGGAKHKLIIVRERVKNHRSTTSDWNAKIREQRTHQIQHSQYYDDDSDHHYESMYSGNYENQQVHHNSSSSHHHHGAGPAPQNLDIIPFDDEEFDSFDSDLDEDEDVKKNDSGVDVSNTRLPDPPSSSNQVYALMQKFKTLSSLSEISKSLSRFATKKRSKHGSRSVGAEGMIPGESASNLYHQGPSTPSKATKSGAKGAKHKGESQSNSQFYANMDFHATVTTSPKSQSPLTPTLVITSTPTQKESLISSPVTPATTPGASSTATTPTNASFTEYTGVVTQQMPVPLARKKSKNGKSFKSKLRRSLVPDTSNLSAFSANPCNKSTFYVNGDSPDMDSGIFTGSDKTLKMEESSVSNNRDNNSFGELVNEIKTRNAKNNQANSTEDVRRRSIATSRPLSPPPAPPVILKENGNGGNAGTRPHSKTSWYDECGVFKPDPVKELEKKAASMTNWYADSGLYQTSGDSVTSSSGSSGVSTGGECNGQDDNSHSMFCNEPLYQIYSAAKLESITRDIEMDTDGYEEIGKRSPEILEEDKKPLRPTALQLVSPQKGPSRTLWSEIPEVINSEILSTLTPTEKRVQEAKFEIITSEASYLKSLNLLKSHFMNHPAFRDVNVLSAADRKTLFSYTIPVLNCSEKLLTDLENCWQDNIMLIGLSDSILKHAENSFKVYVNYCEHQVRLDRILKKLKEANKKFCEILEQVELNPICCGLSFHSFLMLPMQRITRLPLLIDAVLSKLQPDDDEYENWKLTLAMLNKIVSQCNEAANKCEQIYEMQYISRQIEFPHDISPLPIVPMGIPAPNSRRRALVRKGELVHLIWRGDDGKLTFGKKFTKSAVYVFLFTDLLVLTKRKSDDTYLVFDHCCRSMLTVSSGDVIPQLPTKDVAMAGKHLILMTLLENHQGKTVELILSCESETDRTRWLKATEPPLSENPDETLYEQWDCPQVTVLHAYQGKQPDELNLDIGDVVNVTRKMADGWYHGERMRDGEQGWFPGNYTEEVASPHVRARNLKQRYRLLTFTANYLESQKKK